MKDRFVKIYGERNTGTNYLRKLIQQNFSVKLLRGVAPAWKFITRREWSIDLFFQLTQKRNLGWKHMAPDNELIRQFKRYEDLYLIILTKNPYSFLLSLYKRPYHYEGKWDTDFHTFLKKEWQSMGRENLNERTMNNPVELWNIKNQAYINIKKQIPDKVKMLRYVDLVSDLDLIMEELAEEMNTIHRGNYSNVESSTKSDQKTYDYYRDYYVNEKWKEKLDSEAIEIINASLDRELMDYYKYEMLAPNNVNS